MDESISDHESDDAGSESVESFKDDRYVLNEILSNSKEVVSKIPLISKEGALLVFKEYRPDIENIEGRIEVSEVVSELENELHKLSEKIMERLYPFFTVVCIVDAFTLSPVFLESSARVITFEDLLQSPLPAIKRDDGLRKQFCLLYDGLGDDHMLSKRVDSCFAPFENDHREEVLKFLDPLLRSNLKNVLPTLCKAWTTMETVFRWQSMLRSYVDNPVLASIRKEMDEMEKYTTSLQNSTNKLQRDIKQAVEAEDVYFTKRNLKDLKREYSLGRNVSASTMSEAKIAFQRAQEEHFKLVCGLALYFRSYHTSPDPYTGPYADKLQSLLQPWNQFKRCASLADCLDDGTVETDPTKPNIQYGSIRGMCVAIKVFPNVHTPRQFARFNREVTILQRVTMKNIIPFVDAFICDDNNSMDHNHSTGYVVTARAAMDLTGISKLNLTYEAIMGLVHGIVRGVFHLHSLGILHLDIKPQNIVLMQEEGAWVAKIIDFDTSSSEEDRRETTKTRILGVTAGYMAPELVRNGDYGRYSDMYSLGKVLEYMLFHHSFGVEILKNPTIGRLTEQDKTKRPTAKDLCELDMFQGHGGFTAQERFRSAVPLYWEGNQSFQLVLLPEADVLYRHITKMINCGNIGEGGRDQKHPATYNHLEVISVTRVENMTLWTHYAAKRNELYSKLVRSGKAPPIPPIEGVSRPPDYPLVLIPEINEVYLWHGTSHRARHPIETTGFNERFSSLKGMLGAGLYFAVQPGKSDQYVLSD
eukprot:PhF_6_TR1405/c0_g1_i2/m.2442